MHTISTVRDRLTHAMGCKAACNCLTVAAKIGSLVLVPFGIYLLFQPGGRHIQLADYIGSPLGRYSQVPPMAMPYHHGGLLHRYHDVCLAHGKDMNTSSVSMVANVDFTVSFCTSERIASTFWLDIMSSRSPSTVRDNSPPAVRTVNFDSESSRLEKSFRFIFTEDVYVRLFSVYVDMFVLPEAWFTHHAKISRLRDSTNDTGKFHCISNVTFTEFMRLVQSGEDTRWTPVSSKCNPCVIRPQFIGKMDHFEVDAPYIVKAEFGATFNSTVIIKNIIINTFDFQFQMRKREPLLRSCLSVLSHLRVIWTSFQLRGYFKHDDLFPESKFIEALKYVSRTRAANHVLAIFLQTFDEQQVSIQSARGTMLLNMKTYYREVNQDLLLKITRKYQLDFEMFDYEHFPRDIFDPSVE